MNLLAFLDNVENNERWIINWITTYSLNIFENIEYFKRCIIEQTC